MSVRWEGFTHAEIYQRVHEGPGRNASLAAESAWAETEALILRIEERLASAIAESGGGWEGAGADAARSGLTPLGTWAADAAGDARLTAAGVVSQAEQAAWLRDAMPSPTTALWDEPQGRPASDPLYLLEDADTLERKGAEDAAQAVHLMNTYTNNSYENRRNMDYWTFPPEVTVEAVPAGAGGSGSAGAVGVAAAGSPVPAGPEPGTGAATAPGAGTAVAGLPAGALPAGASAGALLPGAPAGALPAGSPVGALPAGSPAGALPPWSPAAAPDGGPAAVAPVGSVPGGTTGPGVLPAPGRGGAATGGSAPSAGGLPGAFPGAPGARPSGRLPGSGAVRPPAEGAARAGGGTTGRGPAAFRPVVPGPPPRSALQPGWRDLVQGVGARGSWAGEGSSRSAELPGRAAAGGERPVGGATAEQVARGAGGRAASAAHPGLYPPMTGGAAAGQDREHRRPSYLVDDADAFADNRWFTPQVISADDPPPPRR